MKFSQKCTIWAEWASRTTLWPPPTLVVGTQERNVSYILTGVNVVLYAKFEYIRSNGVATCRGQTDTHTPILYRCTTEKEKKSPATGLIHAQNLGILFYRFDATVALLSTFLLQRTKYDQTDGCIMKGRGRGLVVSKAQKVPGLIPITFTHFQKKLHALTSRKNSADLPGVRTRSNNNNQGK